jgi:hypothetical protein
MRPPSRARSGSIFGNGQVLVMWTVEDPADSLSQLVSCEQLLRLYNLALAMNPLGLHRVEPRALFGQQAAYDPHSTATVFDFPVVRGNPRSDLPGDVPGSVVPDQNPLARSFELLAGPRKEAGGYPANGPPIHEAQPYLLELRHIESVAEEMAFGSGSSLATDCSMRRRGSPASLQLWRAGLARRLHQVSSRKPTTHSERPSASSINRSRRLFFFGTGDLGK